MEQLIILKSPIECASVGTPFPAGKDLRFSRINGTVLVHHPDDATITKVVEASNVRKIVIKSCSISQILQNLL